MIKMKNLLICQHLTPQARQILSILINPTFLHQLNIQRVNKYLHQLYNKFHLNLQ